ncbi:hypothetical protein FQN51_005774 [Onygenales sp. PD_10]|nr:hypothetical protein FQN51_005774 [Onygenales sp. PD_10]
MPAHFRRQINTCEPGTGTFYRCTPGGFVGCCKIDACTPEGCPDEYASPPADQTPATRPTIGTPTAATPSTIDTPTAATPSTTLRTTAPEPTTTSSIFSQSGTAGPAASPTSTAAGSPLPGASSSSGSSNGALIGGAVGGVLAIVLILIALFLFWRKRRKNQQEQPPPFTQEDAAIGMALGREPKGSPSQSATNSPDPSGNGYSGKLEAGGIGAEKRDTSGTISPYRLSAAASDTTTLMGSPDLGSGSVSSIGSPALGRGSVNLTNDRKSGIIQLGTLSEAPDSSIDGARNPIPSELLASVPARKDITPELDDTMTRPGRAELPTEPERNLINVPRDLKPGSGATPGDPHVPGISQVQPEVSVTSPEGVTFGSNLNTDRRRTKSPDNHVMSFMSYDAVRPAELDSEAVQRPQ